MDLSKSWHEEHLEIFTRNVNRLIKFGVIKSGIALMIIYDFERKYLKERDNNGDVNYPNRFWH